MSTLRVDAEAPTAAGAGLAAAAELFGGASLAEVVRAAELQTRVDRKYLVPVPLFLTMASALPRRTRVLDIGGRRRFGYESVYFDTPHLLLYAQHRQGRRRRYKVRTRTYLDSGDCMLEVKLKGRRGETVKERMPYDAARRAELDEPARAFLDGLLERWYESCAPELSPSLTTAYTRMTLVDLRDGARLTCDVDLRCSDGTTSVDAGGSVLVETKSATGRGQADQILRGLGVRPISISKYCIGIAMLTPHVPANPWNRVLRREFGWVPAKSVGQGAAGGPVPHPVPVRLAACPGPPDAGC